LRAKNQNHVKPINLARHKTRNNFSDFRMKCFSFFYLFEVNLLILKRKFQMHFCYNASGFVFFKELESILYFSFLLILAESLKNHSKSQKNYSKSQKNHKMENLILLDSTWVDLHNKHIIWYALVQNFFFEGFIFFPFFKFIWQILWRNHRK